MPWPIFIVLLFVFILLVFARLAVGDIDDTESADVIELSVDSSNERTMDIYRPTRVSGFGLGVQDGFVVVVQFLGRTRNKIIRSGRPYFLLPLLWRGYRVWVGQGIMVPMKPMKLTLKDNVNVTINLTLEIQVADAPLMVQTALDYITASALRARKVVTSVTSSFEIGPYVQEHDSVDNMMHEALDELLGEIGIRSVTFATERDFAPEVEASMSAAARERLDTQADDIRLKFDKDKATELKDIARGILGAAATEAEVATFAQKLLLAYTAKDVGRGGASVLYPFPASPE